MNNNEACAAYFKGNPAYRRCFSEFEKKWNSYGRAKGIITLKHTSEEERRAIGGPRDPRFLLPLPDLACDSPREAEI